MHWPGEDAHNYKFQIPDLRALLLWNINIQKVRNEYI